MDFPHVVTEHGECTKWWYFITDLAAVLQECLVSLLDLLAAEPDLELSLKQAVGENPVAKLLIRLDCIRKNNP